jgi:hypothetical protein
MCWWAWVMIAWTILGGGVAVWFSKALSLVEARERQSDDRTSCATCGHDQLAHQHYGPGTDCSQCPCPAFRPSR